MPVRYTAMAWAQHFIGAGPHYHPPTGWKVSETNAASLAFPSKTRESEVDIVNYVGHVQLRQGVREDYYSLVYTLYSLRICLIC